MQMQSFFLPFFLNDGFHGIHGFHGLHGIHGLHGFYGIHGIQRHRNAGCVYQV